MDQLTIVRKPTSYGYVNEYEVLETGETFSSLTQNIASAYADYVKFTELQYNISLWMENQGQPEPIEKSNEPTISERQDAIEKMLIDAFADHLSYEILTLTNENCYGCKIDHPSQREHDCCMMDNTTMTCNYLDAAMERIDQDKAMKNFIDLTNEHLPVNSLEFLRYDCKDSRSEIFSRRSEELENKVIEKLN